MRILIDADGCPVTNIAVSISKSHGLECIIVCDSSHIFSSDYAQVITVDKGADSADMKLVNIALKGDIAVTQDYGLAAMCLARNVLALTRTAGYMTVPTLMHCFYQDILQRRYAEAVADSKVRQSAPNSRTRISGWLLPN